MNKNTKTNALVALRGMFTEMLKNRDSSVENQATCGPDKIEFWKESEAYWNQQYIEVQEAYDDVMANH